MNVDYVRVLRTPGSERFIVRMARVDSALIELHYLASGAVHGTLIVFDGAGISAPDIPTVLTHIDEVLLPDVSFDDEKLLFTVVVGRVHGSYEAESQSALTIDAGQTTNRGGHENE